jgi:hypothetical protein
LVGIVTTSPISVAVHQLTRLFLADPAVRLTPDQIRQLIALDEAETRMVIDALKNVGVLVEGGDGRLAARPVTAA